MFYVALLLLVLYVATQPAFASLVSRVNRRRVSRGQRPLPRWFYSAPIWVTEKQYERAARDRHGRA